MRNQYEPSQRLLRRPEVQEKTGMARSTIYRYMSLGLFPQPVKLGEKAVAWQESEIDRWISERVLGGTSDG